MKIPTSPPPANLSKPFWKWIYRGLLLIIAILTTLTLLGGLLPRRVSARAKVVKAQTSVDNFAKALDQYAIEYGYHPEGAPADLLRTLRGDNQRKIIFFECQEREVNATGEFIDPWGKPYRIDQSDPSNPRVYSTGPNHLDEHGAQGSDDIVAIRKINR